MPVRSFTIPSDLEGRRVDEVVSALMGISVKAAKRLCEQGRVRRVRSSLKKGERLCAGDELAVDEATLHPSAIPVLSVVAQTPAYLVVDKPAGLHSHKLRAEDPPSALDAAALIDPLILTAGPDPREGGLLHRLDGGTSGALAFARTARAYELGRAAFKSGAAHKEYLALVYGELPVEGEITAEIAHSPSDVRRSVVVDGDSRHRGKPRSAVTRWKTRARKGRYALLLVEADGGRRHQVRVHLAHAGAPLVGDDLYGGPAWDPALALPGHALHASRLVVPHPEFPVDAAVPPPPDFARAVRALTQGEP